MLQVRLRLPLPLSAFPHLLQKLEQLTNQFIEEIRTLAAGLEDLNFTNFLTHLEKVTPAEPLRILGMESHESFSFGRSFAQ